MDLTEPDAGSDLQSVMLKATEPPDGHMAAHGVKALITNATVTSTFVAWLRSEAGYKVTVVPLHVYLYTNVTEA
ncbi:acyl-CoA dehydrogenase family protein [Duncaniella dubosii]|uniref:acyl-CoA dehydrogenase family protein n=1 Tax=Duncaniella dubosii TaxID=2518971 RepID=UPI003F67A0BE